MNKPELIEAINAINPKIKASDDHTVVQLEAMHKGLTSGETIADLTTSLQEATEKVSSLESATQGSVHTFSFKKKNYQVLGGVRYRGEDGVVHRLTAKEIAANKEVREGLVEKGSGLVVELS